MGEKKHFRFFQNTQCEFFPCHKGIPEEKFNCLFCFCPLYALGESCGGTFTLTERGVKDCSACNFPHKRENYAAVLARCSELSVRLREARED